MALALYAFAPTAGSAGTAPAGFFSDRLWLWIATSEANATLARFAWTLAGSAVVPAILRELAAPRTDAEYQQHKAQYPAPRIFTGVVEFSGLAAGTSRTITATSPGGEAARLEAATLPAQLPPLGATDAFRLLLGSCFHHATDSGRAGQNLAAMKLAPHLSLFMGDQVYLDLPTLADFPDDKAWLAAKFESDYARNWLGTGSGGLAAGALTGGFARAPNAFLPDDHEFWNNAPFASAIIGNSSTPEGRRHWIDAAQPMIDAFQRTPGTAAGGVSIIDVDPLSILMLDTRGARRETLSGPGALIPPASATALNGWIDALVARHRANVLTVGLFVSGQSMLDPPAGFVAGSFADWALANFVDDYATILRALERAAAAGVPMILATGDVHWGRVALLHPRLDARIAFVEAISSPLSLVETVVVDEWKRAKGWLGSFFGRRNDWPRHSDPAKPPQKWGTQLQYETKEGETTGRRGDHAMRVDFRRKGTGVEIEPVFLGFRPHATGIDEQSAGRIVLLPQR